MSTEPDIEARKKAAVAFIRRAREGDRVPLDELVHPDARHHNPYFAAGMPTLLDAIVTAAGEAPKRVTTVKHVIAEGDFVAVHSHVQPNPDHPGMAVVHLFRFEGDQIVELWDVGQAIPETNPNADGMF